MKFNLRRPCSDCPFRNDSPGYLHPERARELSEGPMQNDQQWLACHKTTVEGEDGERAIVDDSQVCAGQMVFLIKNRMQNFPMRLAAAMGVLSFSDLDMSAPVCDSVEEMVERHRKSW